MPYGERPFDLLVTPHHSGDASPAVHVQVKNWIVPRRAPKNTICVSGEALDVAELDREIDELISDLNALKRRGRMIFGTAKS